ncbi:MAG: protein kinase [Ancalomicrobiaceae bacterium]|nr:protein kinase [Ancalomicrobiaceae bacterium]
MLNGPQLTVGGTLVPGSRLNEVWEIDEKIAIGGMGEVYRGHNIQTHDRVAIKVVRLDFADADLAMAMFRKEAAALNTLYHEAIVRYYMFALDPTIGRPYLVMEYVDGRSLKAILAERPLTFHETWLLAERVGSGLAVAHDHGIFHRDISPDNIILLADDPAKAKIIDFGIARNVGGSLNTVIGQGFAGKYSYASPEQIGAYGGDIGASSDIYSLGLVLAEANTARRRDMVGSALEVVQKRQRVPDLSDVDARLQPILSRMLAPDPDDRPASLYEVLAELRSDPKGTHVGTRHPGETVWSPRPHAVSGGETTRATQHPAIPAGRQPPAGPPPATNAGSPAGTVGTPRSWLLPIVALAVATFAAAAGGVWWMLAQPGPLPTIVKGPTPVVDLAPAAEAKRPSSPPIAAPPVVPPVTGLQPSESPAKPPPPVIAAQDPSPAVIATQQQPPAATLADPVATRQPTGAAPVPAQEEPASEPPKLPSGSVPIPPPVGPVPPLPVDGQTVSLPPAATPSAPALAISQPPAAAVETSQAAPTSPVPVSPKPDERKGEVVGNDAYANLKFAQPTPVDVQRYLTQYARGNCIYLEPKRTDIGAATADAYGSSVRPFEVLDGDFQRTFGFPVDINLHLVMPAHCAILDYMAKTGRSGQADLTLDTEKLAEKSVLTGLATTEAGRRLGVVLVEDDGSVRPIAVAEAGSGRAPIRVSVARRTSGGDKPQLVVAVATASDLELFRTRRTLSIADFLGQLSGSADLGQLSLKMKYLVITH